MRSSLIITILLTVFISCNAPQEQEEVITFPVGSVAPEWTRNASIYEANIRQHTPAGTFNAFSEHLDSIKALGVDIVWLMPIFPISEKFRKATQNILVDEIKDPEQRKKYLGSYYAIKDYKGVNPDLGTEADFRALITKAHSLSMHVILDIAANHTGWDNEWLITHPEYYTRIKKGSTPWNPEWMNAHPDYYAELSERGFTYPMSSNDETDWWDTADLNYEDAGLRSAMLDVLKFWVEEYDVDGYRCDVAMKVPTDFWESARKELDQIKPVFMLAEAEEIDHLNYAFDMNYGWELHHIMNKIAQGEMNVNNLTKYLEKYSKQYGPDAYRMNFITNHDENSWNGTINERMGDAQYALAGLMTTLPGMPLIYSGQEVGLDKKLRFFEKDTVTWKASKLRNFYTTLLQEKKRNRALWNGTAGGQLDLIETSKPNDVFAFTREKDGDKIIAVFNFSPDINEFDFKSRPALTGLTDLFDKQGEEKLASETISLEPWEFIILTSKK